jgi:hypothetical protein
LQRPCSGPAARLAIVVTMMNTLTSNAALEIAHRTINDRIREAEVRAQMAALRAERRAEAHARHTDVAEGIPPVSTPWKSWTAWFARPAH